MNQAVQESRKGLGALAADGRRVAIQPADVEGRFTRLRHWVFALLIAVYAALPWIEIGGHPAVFLDVQSRSFFLFGATFNAQDLWLLFFLLSGLGFALIVVTTLLGRLWCGYACPQTVFLEGVARRIERWIEGPSGTRLRRAARPATFDKVWRKSVVHALYLLVAAVVAHIFLSYFVSVPELWTMMAEGPGAHATAFAWVLGITAVIYIDLAWFREQLCLIVCPYGRLQSVLIDSDSLIIGYDEKRGEPRGKASAEKAGDCVDCRRCVAVCPTGIDIRKGLQIDCIGCAACVDACDDIMHKLGREPGLIRYDSQRGLAGEKRRFWRPRLGLYAVLGVIGLVVAGIGVSGRSGFEAHLMRARGTTYVVDGDVVRNVFDVRLANKHGEPWRFEIRPADSEALEYVIATESVEVPSMGTRTVPIFVQAPRGEGRGEAVAIRVVDEQGEERVLEARFLAPAR